jgi:phenylacetate-CoA ligase
MRFASTLRAYEMLGWKFGEPQLRLWHQTLGMSRTQVIREKFDAYLQNRKFVGAFQIDHSAIEGLLNQIDRERPVLIDGYAESLNMLSLHAQRRSNWSPRAILSSAQELPKITQMNIEGMFGCKVLNKYGAREFSGIAYECLSQQGMHVLMESYIVEILRNGKPVLPGEVGEVFITDLNNYSMPLIRYRIGDLAELSPLLNSCPCGRSTTKISRIIGRTQALVEGGNGVLMPGTFFSHFFKEYFDYVKSYQIIQSADKSIKIKLIPTARMHSDIPLEITRGLKIHLGSDSLVTCELVDEIPLGRTGKRQSVVSELHFDFQESKSKLLKN